MTPVMPHSPRLKQIRRKRTLFGRNSERALDEPTESQTEVKKPRRYQRRPSRNRPQSDTEPENAPNAKEDGVDAASNQEKRTHADSEACRYCPSTIVQRSKQADKAKNDLLDLIESQRSGGSRNRDDPRVEQSADNPVMPLQSCITVSSKSSFRC